MPPELRKDQRTCQWDEKIAGDKRSLGLQLQSMTPSQSKMEAETTNPNSEGNAGQPEALSRVRNVALLGKTFDHAMAQSEGSLSSTRQWQGQLL
jgi:hypothetical protein